MNIALNPYSAFFIGKRDNLLYGFGSAICSDPDLVTQISSGYFANPSSSEQGFYSENYSLALKKDGSVSFIQGMNVDFVPPAGLKNIVHISAGAKHTLAVEGKNKSVIAWGSNEHNQCSIPESIEGIEYLNQPVSKVAAGFKHSLALMESGSVLSWGDPIGSTPSSILGKIVTDISTKGFHSLALINDGTVIGWGKITDYSLEYNILHQEAGLLVPQNLTNVTKISAGFSHCLALKSDGTVVAWGDNTYGQCNIPVGLNNVNSICAGAFNSLVIKNDGSIVTWGQWESRILDSLKKISIYQSNAVTPRIEAYGDTSYVLTSVGDLFFHGVSGSINHPGTLVDSNVEKFKVFDSQNVSASSVYTPPSVGLYLNSSNTSNLTNFSISSLTQSTASSGVLSSFTLELWFYPIATSQNQLTGRTLLADTLSSSQSNFVLAWFNNEGTGAGTGFKFGFYNRKISSYTGCTANYSSYQWYTQSAGTVDLNKWNHVLVSIEMTSTPSGGTYLSKPITSGWKYETRVYLNGVHQSSAEHSFLAPVCSGSTINSYAYVAQGSIPSSNSLKIGRRWDNDSTTYKFNGYIRNYQIKYGEKKLQNETFTPTPLNTVLPNTSLTTNTTRFISNDAGSYYQYFSSGGSYFYDFPPVTAGCAVYKKFDGTTGWHGSGTDTTNRPVFESVLDRPPMLQYGFEIDSSGTLKLATGESALSGNYTYLNQLLNSPVRDVVSISSTARIHNFVDGVTTCHFLVLTKRGIVGLMPTSSGSYSNKAKPINWMKDLYFYKTEIPNAFNNYPPLTDAYSYSEITPYPNMSMGALGIIKDSFNTNSTCLIKDSTYVSPTSIIIIKGLPQGTLCYESGTDSYRTTDRGKISGSTFKAGSHTIYVSINNFLSEYAPILFYKAIIDITTYLNVGSPMASAQERLYDDFLYAYYDSSTKQISGIFPDLLNTVVLGGNFYPQSINGLYGNQSSANVDGLYINIDYDGKRKLPKIPGEYTFTGVCYSQGFELIKTFNVIVGSSNQLISGDKQISGTTISSSPSLPSSFIKHIRWGKDIKQIKNGDTSVYSECNFLSGSVNITQNLVHTSNFFKRPILFDRKSYIYKDFVNEQKYVTILPNSYLSSTASDYFTQGASSFPSFSNLNCLVLFDLADSIAYNDFEFYFKLTDSGYTTFTTAFDAGMFHASSLDFFINYGNSSMGGIKSSGTNGVIGITNRSPFYIVNKVQLYNYETNTTFLSHTPPSSTTQEIPTYSVYRSIKRTGNKIEIKDGYTYPPDGSIGSATIEDYIFINKYVGVCFNSSACVSDINLIVGPKTLDYSKPFKPIRVLTSNASYDSFRAKWSRSAEITGATMDISTDLDFTNIIRSNLDCTGTVVSSFPDSGSNRYFDVSNQNIRPGDGYLQEATTYYYRIKHKKENESGDYSAVKTATTTIEPITLSYENSFLGSDSLGFSVDNSSSSPFMSISNGLGTLLNTLYGNSGSITLIRELNPQKDDFYVRLYVRGAQEYYFSYSINKSSYMVTNPLGLLSQSISFLTQNKNVTKIEYKFSSDVRNITLNFNAYPINLLNDFVYVNTSLMDFLGFKSINPFFICSKEVTVKEWKEVVTYVNERNLGYDLVDASVYSSLNEPISNINWYDAIKFCNAKSEMNWLSPVYRNSNGTVYRSGETSPIVYWTSDGYRLPIEVEWDYAARGGAFSKNYVYSGSNTLNDVAWSSVNSGNSIKQVGLKSPNEIAIYDMSGNVSEWVLDNYSQSDPVPSSQPNPHYLSTVLLLHFNNNVVDSSLYNLSPYNYSSYGSSYPITVNTVSKFGGYSLLSSSNQRKLGLIFYSKNIYDFCNGFSIDMWIYPTGFLSTKEQVLIELQIGNLLYAMTVYYNQSDGLWYLSYCCNNDDSKRIIGTTPISLNQWQHVAWCYFPETYNNVIYLDGNSQGSLKQRIVVTDSGDEKYIKISKGQNSWLNDSFDGYIDELNFTSSVRYTSDFSVPTQEYSNQIWSNLIPSDSKQRLLRGGNYLSNASDMLLSNRTSIYSSPSTKDIRYGMRLAKSNWSFISGQYSRLFLIDYTQLTTTSFAVEFEYGKIGNISASTDKIEISTDSGITWQDLSWSGGSNQIFNLNVPQYEVRYIIARINKQNKIYNQVSNTLKIENFSVIPNIESLIPISYIDKILKANISYANPQEIQSYEYSVNNTLDFVGIPAEDVSGTFITMYPSNYGIDVDKNLGVKVRILKNDNKYSLASESKLIEFNLDVPSISNCTLLIDHLFYSVSDNLPPRKILSYFLDFKSITPNGFQFKPSSSNSWTGIDAVEINDKIAKFEKFVNIDEYTEFQSRYTTVWGLNSDIAIGNTGPLLLPSPTTPEITNVSWSHTTYNLSISFNYSGVYYPNYNRTVIRYKLNNDTEWSHAASSVSKSETQQNSYSVTIPQYNNVIEEAQYIKISLGLVYTNSLVKYSDDSNTASFYTTIPLGGPVLSSVSQLSYTMVSNGITWTIKIEQSNYISGVLRYEANFKFNYWDENEDWTDIGLGQQYNSGLLFITTFNRPWWQIMGAGGELRVKLRAVFVDETMSPESNTVSTFVYYSMGGGDDGEPPLPF